MIPTRTAEWIVTALIGLGVVALITAALTAPHYGATSSSSEQWAEWRRMPAEERVSYARTYEELSRSDDGVRSLARAEAFAALTESERGLMRAIEAAIRETLSSAQGAAYRDSIPAGEARARAVLRIMQQHYPEKLERLRESTRK